MKTLGLSPKLILPALGQLVAAVANLILSGGWTKAVQAQILTLVLTTVVGYLARPGVTTDAVSAEPQPTVEG